MKKGEDLISVVVPVYNVQDYLKECIDSIINQTYKNIEIILVNDGSTDKSPQICDQYKKDDDRVRVIHKRNEGLSEARNTGIENANGKYITFIDSDDWIDVNYCKILYDALVKNKCDISMCNLQKVYNSGEIFESNVDNYIQKYTNIEALEKFEDTIYVVAVSKLYNINLFSNLRYVSSKVHEDEFIFHKIFYQAKNIVHVNKNLYAYRQRDNSITNSKYSLKRLDSIEALEDRLHFYKLQNLHGLKNKTTALYMYMLKDNIAKLNQSDITNRESIVDQLYNKLMKQYRECKKTKYISYNFYLFTKFSTLFPKLFKKYICK